MPHPWDPSMEGFVPKIEEYKYLDKWGTALTCGKHRSKNVFFHDTASIWKRWQNTYIGDAGPIYFRHWLNCQEKYGAGNPDCRKIRWWAENVAHCVPLAEWDDWWKDEFYDRQIGQHWNTICGEEFEEASTLLKDLKEKREALSLKFKDVLKTKAKEDPMGKILHEISLMEELSRDPVADLVEAGTLSQEDVEAAAAHKLKELQALRDDALWAEVKGTLLPGLAATCRSLRLKTTLMNEVLAKRKEEADQVNQSRPKFRIPHMRVNYEKPGMYEYSTWFGRFLPKTTQFGFPEIEEEE